MRLSAALSRLRPSPTVAISAQARALKAEGRDVIALSAGEPDFDTPDHIKQAAADAMARGETKYVSPDGLPELKKAVIGKFSRENGLEYALNEVMVTAGGKQAIFNAMAVTLDPGDEVIVPAPYWVSYPDIVRYCGAVAVIVDCPMEGGFRLRPEALEAAITPRTRWVMLNTPSNPTGAGYSADELAALGEVLERHPDVLVLCDDIYEHIAYAPYRFATLAQVAPKLRDRILIINGVSKSHAMTGWRIGYAAGPAELIKAMVTLQSQTVTCASSVSQWAAVAALNGPQDYITESNKAFLRRRDMVAAALNEAPGIDCPVPDGAFYVFPSIAGLIGKTSAGGVKIVDDAAFTSALLDETGVAVAPGAAFGLSPHFRVSYADADDVLRDACGRIKKFCMELS